MKARTLTLLILICFSSLSYGAQLGDKYILSVGVGIIDRPQEQEMVTKGSSASITFDYNFIRVGYNSMDHKLDFSKYNYDWPVTLNTVSIYGAAKFTNGEEFETFGLIGAGFLNSHFNIGNGTKKQSNAEITTVIGGGMTIHTDFVNFGGQWLLFNGSSKYNEEITVATGSSQIQFTIGATF